MVIFLAANVSFLNCCYDGKVHMYLKTKELKKKKFNTLTANYEYSPSKRENLPLPIQMQISEKQKNIF